MQGGYRRPEYGSPPTRGDSGNLRPRTTGRSDRDSDTQSEKETDPGKRFGNQSRKTWQGAEHDGLLGSGSSPRPPPAPKRRSNDQQQLNRTNEPYHPPPPDKVYSVPSLCHSLSHIPKPLTPKTPPPDFPPLACKTAAQTPYSRLIHTPILTSNYTVPTPQKPATQTPSSKSTPSTSNPSQSYFDKPNPENIIMTQFHTEPKIPQLKTFVASIFMPTCQWLADDILKTQNYYELILVDTQSIEIQHIQNKQDPNRIDYSKLYIKQVLHPSHFYNIHSTRNFSVNYFPKGFNYADYMQAWYRILYIRSFDHSWYINFHRHFNGDIPMWFYDWWSTIGPSKEILPTPVLEGLDTFKKLSKCKPFEKTLFFHSTFRVPWIFAWSFQIKPIHSNMPFSLVRQFKIKWWNDYKTELCSATAVTHYLETRETTVGNGWSQIPLQQPLKRQKIMEGSRLYYNSEDKM